jgi:hypothetical protein
LVAPKKVKMSIRTALVNFMLVLLAAAAAAQSPTAPLPPGASPQPADVASPEAIIQAVYSVISGPAGAPRDWQRLRSLMAPGAIFAVTRAGADGTLKTRVLSVEDYISASSKSLASEAFYEHGAVGQIWRYAHIATVVSPYESRHAQAEAPFQRGINSFQLASDGMQWRIISISWEGETPAFPLPPEAGAQLRGK